MVGQIAQVALVVVSIWFTFNIHDPAAMMTVFISAIPAGINVLVGIWNGDPLMEGFFNVAYVFLIFGTASEAPGFVALVGGLLVVWNIVQSPIFIKFSASRQQARAKHLNRQIARFKGSQGGGDEEE